MTFIEFLKWHAEFNNAPVPMVEKALAAAELSCPVDVWGDKQPEAVAHLAAHKLCMAPGGYGLRTEAKGATGYDLTVYGTQFKTLMRGVSLFGARIVGGLGNAH